MNKRNAGIGGIIFIILAALSAYFGQDLLGDFDPTQDETSSDTPPIITVPDESDATDWYEVYFTDPACLPEAERVGGVDEVVAEAIALAETQVDIAAFDLDSESIVQALIDREEAGVPVRAVTDSSNEDLSSIRRMRRHGISVVEDKRRALMHNKFIVIDGRYLWVGSMNFTSNGAFCNNNNLVFIDSPRLAANYTVEMDEMYEDRLFGPTSPENTPNEKLFIGGIEVENYFAPEKELSPIIARTVARAQEEILFMAFSFTDDLIGEAMLGRADAGVRLHGIFETVGSDTEFSYFSRMDSLRLPNLEVRKDGNSRTMHHKVIIVDRKTVLFGSFNFSDSANRRNDENIIIIHDPTFASFFIEEFDLVWLEAQ